MALVILLREQNGLRFVRTALTGNGGDREADYELDIRPQGGGEMQRGAHVVLARQEDGTWRVSRFSETQPR